MREYQSGSGDGSANATFGPGLVFEGKLSFQGQVRFDGTFTGEITTDDLLIIGETAKVSADITSLLVITAGQREDQARDSLRSAARPREADLDPVAPWTGRRFDGYCNMWTTRRRVDSDRRGRSVAARNQNTTIAATGGPLETQPPIFRQ